MIAAYIRAQRDRFFPSGRQLDETEITVLQPFFGSERLKWVQVHNLKRAELPNPDFYPSLRQMGFRDLPNFSRMAAITFVDAIAFREAITMPVLFHEMVHVVQYDFLGVEAFAALYVRGFIEGGGYEKIPLEKSAYELDARFSADPKKIFDVQAEVRSWREKGRF